MKQRGLSIAILGGMAVLLGTAFAPPRQTQEREFVVPAGFRVEPVFTDTSIGSLVALTFDTHGRMVVAKEGRPVYTLIPNGSGGYEQRSFTDSIRTSQGILFDGPDLLVTGVGPNGVGMYRVTDTDGDARGDRIDEVGTSNRQIEDHGAHNMSWGPDGYLYWANGNVSAPYEQHSPLSPVRSFDDSEPLVRDIRMWPTHRTPGGKFYRKNVALHPTTAVTTGGGGSLASDTAQWELFASGFRNIYDGAFNLDGELFTYDSDMEPDLAFPHYRNTRLDHVLPGAEYGYREGNAIHQEWFYDDVPQMENEGRGSPTGVYVLQTYNYPAEYWDTPIFADWSRGRILVSKLTKNGATYTPQTSAFVTATPMNVSDMEVGPDGNLYFVLGGRGTTGGIYRLVYTGSNAMRRPAATTPLDRVLTMQQPRSAYSRTLAADTKAQLGERNWQTQLVAVVRNASAPTERRVRALELLQVYGPAPDEALLSTLAQDASWEVRSAAAYYLGMKPTESSRTRLIALLRDSDPFVQRRAAEALMRTGVNQAQTLPAAVAPQLLSMLGSQDRMVRYQSRVLLREVPVNRWLEPTLRLPNGVQAYEGLLAIVQQTRSMDMVDYGRIVNRELELLQANPSDAQLLQLVRLMEYTKTKDKGASIQVRNSASRVTGGMAGPLGGGGARPPGAAGGAAPGAQGAPGAGGPAAPGAGAPGAGGPGAGGPGGGGGFGGFGGGSVWSQIGTALLARFPSSDWRLDREIARMLATLQTPGALPKLVQEVAQPTNVPAGEFETALKQRMHMADMASTFKTGWEPPTIETLTAFFEAGAKDRTVAGNYANAWRTDFLANIPAAASAASQARITAATPAAGAFPGAPGGAPPAPRP